MNSVPSCCLPTLLDQVNANPTPIRGLVDGLIVGYGLHEFADHLGRHSGTVALGDHVTRHAIVAAAFCALHVAHLGPPTHSLGCNFSNMASMRSSCSLSSLHRRTSMYAPDPARSSAGIFRSSIAII